MTSASASPLASVASLYRYPLKGFTPQRLEQVSLLAGEALPFDRAYAIENGSRDFDETDPQFFPKVKFLQLMQFERVASLEADFDEETHRLVLSRQGKQLVQGDLSSAIGRQLIEQFISAYFKEELRGAPRIVHAPGHTFSDVARKCVSLINLKSATDLERVVGKPVNPLRFRGNIYFSTDNPWEEKNWVGKTLTIGEVELEVIEGIVRCAATNVDPESAERDLHLPRTLSDAFGENIMGLYAEVKKPGRVQMGDAFTLAD